MADKYIKFSLRLTEEQIKKLQVLANKKNLTRAEVLREIIDTDLENIERIIDEKKELKENFKTLAFQLQKVGVVLNQANRNFFENKEVKIEEVKGGIEELWQLLKQLKE